MMDNNLQATFSPTMQLFKVKKRMCDRDRLQLLYDRAHEICASLEPRIHPSQFEEDGSLTHSITLTYSCEHWQDMTGRTAQFLVPVELAELQKVIAKDYQAYCELVDKMPLYPGDSARITELLTSAKWDSLALLLESLAHAAGGRLEMSCSEVTYYRFSRLPRQTVCERELLQKAYNVKGRQFHFLLPVDYALLRDFLAKDAELYADLPESKKRSARWEGFWKRKQALRAEYVLKDERS